MKQIKKFMKQIKKFMKQVKYIDIKRSSLSESLMVGPAVSESVMAV